MTSRTPHDHQRLTLRLPLPEGPLLHFTLIEPERPAEAPHGQAALSDQAVYAPVRREIQVIAEFGNGEQRTLNRRQFRQLCEALETIRRQAVTLDASRVALTQFLRRSEEST